MEDNTNKAKKIRGDYELTEKENEQYEAICAHSDIDKSARKQTAALVRRLSLIHISEPTRPAA
jgi:hypothetical protein